MQRYVLIPIPKNPYSRIGPRKWQDWYLQVEKTISIARRLEQEGFQVSIALLSGFHPKGKPSELSIYAEAFSKLDSQLEILLYKQTHDTLGQVQKSFELQKTLHAQLIFITAWMQYPRVLFLTRGKKAQHYGVFGIPQPAFALIDPVCIVLQPLVHLLGLSSFLQRIIVRQREKGRILF